MKKRSAGMILFALFFFVLGLFWLVAVQKRCEAISPTKRAKSAVSQGKVEAVREEKEDNLLIIHFRSPHAKWYHFVFFWTIACFELGVGFLFMLAAAAILRLYRRARIWVFTALAADIVYKLAVCLYMFFCAIPLARLSANKNIMLAYFMPDKSLFSTISAYLSGIRMYPPFGSLGIAFIYAGFMIFCFYYFNRKSIQAKFVS